MTSVLIKVSGILFQPDYLLQDLLKLLSDKPFEEGSGRPTERSGSVGSARTAKMVPLKGGQGPALPAGSPFLQE